jgi:hypothetical protein
MILRAGRSNRSDAGRSNQALRSVQGGLAVGAISLALATTVLAQPPQGRGGPPPTGRVGAPVDLTGTWVSVVTEDWEARMAPPVKGDYTTIEQVMTPEARKVADGWQASMDGRCEAYGVGGVMRLPGRLRISWQDDNTLKIETDAGSQTRLLRFAASGASGTTAPARTLQGSSVAEWQRGGGQQDAFLGRGVGAAGQRWGGLKVVTTNMLAGWLRTNGVPYGERATVTEHFTRFTHPVAGDWFVVTTVVEDPQYLTGPFITSSNFKKEPNDSKFKATACKS